MSTDDALERSIDAVFAALNAGDAKALEPLCTPAALGGLVAHMTPSGRQFTRFPMVITNADRAAVRGISLLGEQTPEPLWLGFERQGGWRCAALPTSRQDAQRWMTARQDAAAVNELFGRVAEALNRGDAAELRGLTHADWQSHPASAERLAQTLPPGTVVELIGAPRSMAGRAVAPLSLGDDANIWLAASRDGAQMELLTQLDESGARAWLRGDTTVLPVWSNLPEDTRAHQLAEHIVRAITEGAPAPAGADLAAWAILTEPPADGLEAHVGVTRALPDMNRAALQIRLVDPSDPDWTEEERWGYLERVDADSPWRLTRAAASGRVALLLEGIATGWQRTTPEPEKRSAPGPDLSQVFDGIARGFSDRVKRATAEADGVVDLAKERARRATNASDGGELGDLLKRALASALPTDADGKPQNVDSDVLREQGPEIATALFSAITRALVPDTLSMNVPADPLSDDLQSDGSDGPKRVDVDLGSLLSGLFESARTPPRSTDDDEEPDA